MRDDTVFRVTNFRYHASLSSDRVCFCRRYNDLTFQRITTANPTDPILTREPEAVAAGRWLGNSSCSLPAEFTRCGGRRTFGAVAHWDVYTLIMRRVRRQKNH